MSSNYRSGTVGVAEPLFYSDSQLITGLFVQCEVQKQGAVAAQQTVNLSEVAYHPGCYEGTVTLNTEGTYNLLYIPYSDAGHTTVAELAPISSEVMTVRLTSDSFGSASTQPILPAEAFMGKEIRDLVLKLAADQSILDEKINQYFEREIPQPKVEVKTERVNVDLNPVLDAIRNMPKVNVPDYSMELSNISGKIDKIKPTDLKEVVDNLNSVLTAIKGIKIADLTPKLNDIMTRLKNMKLDVKTEKVIVDFTEVRAEIKDLMSELKTYQELKGVNKYLGDIKSSVSELKILLLDLKKIEQAVKDKTNLEKMDSLNLNRFTVLLNEIKGQFKEWGNYLTKTQKDQIKSLAEKIDEIEA